MRTPISKLNIVITLFFIIGVFSVIRGLLFIYVAIGFGGPGGLVYLSKPLFWVEIALFFIISFIIAIDLIKRRNSGRILGIIAGLLLIIYGIVVAIMDVIQNLSVNLITIPIFGLLNIIAGTVIALFLFDKNIAVLFRHTLPIEKEPGTTV